MAGQRNSHNITGKKWKPEQSKNKYGNDKLNTNRKKM